ncbi:hypothetical protein NUACC26_008180 [Scytonema sp. NUACC26]
MKNNSLKNISALHSSEMNEQVINTDALGIDTDALVQMLCQEMQAEVKTSLECMEAVAKRIAREVECICDKSSRIKTSGQVTSWLITLARHRLQKCLHYYQLGSKKGRQELHSQLGAIVYRHVATPNSDLGFDALYNLIEDFLQAFYLEAIKAFRRENELAEDYTPRTQLELVEYMAFTEQYAKRHINLPGGANQQLVILRAQGFARRLPQETTADIERLVESGKTEVLSDNLQSVNRSNLTFYLPQELYTQLVFFSDYDVDLMSEIVGQAFASFLVNTDVSDVSNQNQQTYTYKDYDKILEMNPNDYKAWYGYGVVRKNLGSYEEAIVYLDKAVEIKPNYYKAWYARGNALYGLDLYEEAITSYDKAIKFKPDYAEAWYYRGQALAQLGSHEEAIASYLEVIKIRPELHQICYNKDISPVYLSSFEQGEIAESGETNNSESYQRNSVVQQVPSQIIAQPNFAPAEESERDRVISELVDYLESQGQSDCVDYLTLKLQDFSAPEIDRILGLTSRQRDYLQQRFKYHVEKFAKQHHWQLVHQ